jgi:hypothetical protein
MIGVFTCSHKNGERIVSTDGVPGGPGLTVNDIVQGNAGISRGGDYCDAEARCGQCTGTDIEVVLGRDLDLLLITPSPSIHLQDQNVASFQPADRVADGLRAITAGF